MLQDTFKLLLILASDTQKEINLVHPGVETCQKSTSFIDQNWAKASKDMCMKDSHAKLFHTHTQNIQTKFLKKEPPIFFGFFRRGDASIELSFSHVHIRDLLQKNTVFNNEKHSWLQGTTKKSDPSSMHSTPKNIHAI